MCACRAFVISCAAAFSKKDLVSARLGRAAALTPNVKQSRAGPPGFCSTSGRVQRKESLQALATARLRWDSLLTHHPHPVPKILHATVHS